jgi:hypothetical protein
MDDDCIPARLDLYLPVGIPADRQLDLDRLPHTIINVTIFDPTERSPGRFLVSDVVGLRVNRLSKDLLKRVLGNIEHILAVTSVFCDIGLLTNETSVGEYLTDGEIGRRSGAIIPSGLTWNVRAPRHATIYSPFKSLVNRDSHPAMMTR